MINQQIVLLLGRTARENGIELCASRDLLATPRFSLGDPLRAPISRLRSANDANGCLSDDRLEVEETLIHEADFELDSGRDATRDLLGLPERPTAVFCANDVQAIGALHECEEHGVRVPADISLVGFDDLPVAKYVRPQLTTIRVPAQRMGELAATRIIEAQRTGGSAGGAELPIELVVRDSTGPVPRRSPGHPSIP
jgi:DNA-binding LacI/PurR family transcriptional regulator